MKTSPIGRALAALVGVAALSATASAGIAGDVIKSFSLFNHPDGNVAPSAYGLRLDHFALSNAGVTDEQVTFSFEEGGLSTVSLNVIDDGGDIRLHIFGTVWGNSANGGANLGKYNLDVLYEDVDVLSDGWIVEEDEEFIGGLTPADATADGIVGMGTFIELFSKARDDDLVFSFRDQEHRGNPGWNGFGWVMSDESRGTQDFLFRAEMDMPGRVIPLPSAAAMGLVGLGLVAARRRRR